MIIMENTINSPKIDANGQNNYKIAFKKLSLLHSTEYNIFESTEINCCTKCHTN